MLADMLMFYANFSSLTFVHVSMLLTYACVLTGNDHPTGHDARIMNGTDVFNMAEKRIFEITAKYGAPFVDIRALTGSCVWSRCFSDGDHRSRFVNRMKAQILLNLMCRTTHG